jgi:hypothetical protein
MDTTGPMPYPLLNTVINPASAHGGRKCIKGVTFTTPIRPAFSRSLYDEFLAFQDKIPDAGALIVLEFTSVAKVCSVPHSATAFANRGEYQNAFVGPKCTNPINDGPYRAWAREMAAKFQEEMRRQKSKGEVKLEVEGVGQYGNYDSEFGLPPFPSIFRSG